MVIGIVDDWPWVMVAVIGSMSTVFLSQTAYRVTSCVTLREPMVSVDVSYRDHPLKV